ncbi:sugar ABC transporter substrate-binding protein [Streptomyces sp. NPDC059070]|uniref:sugar ABC transporter substrate-binding protein n=1 Tax=unclassified Streptomyces TaxID=2593676 RepID=UPI0034E1F9FC
MSTRTGRGAMTVGVVAMAVTLAACGGGSKSDSADAAGKKRDLKIGLLLPEKQAARYEKSDKPLIEKMVSELTSGKGQVVYANAEQDAARQSRQIDEMITKKVDSLIVDAVDSKAIGPAVQRAKDAGIPVVAFDRLAEGPVDAYVSFDNEDVGHVQARALLDVLGDKAQDGQIVMMNGARTDPNAAQFKKGAHAELDNKVHIGKEYDTKEWKPENAEANMKSAIAALGKNKIVGVYSANDGMAGGIIDALKAAGVTKLPPITGQDTELAGVQRIVAGEQYMSVYKSYAEESPIAAQMAVALARKQSLVSIANSKTNSPTTSDIPTALVPVVAVIKANIRNTVISDGLYTIDEICTPKYKADCKAAGLQ